MCSFIDLLTLPEVPYLSKKQTFHKSKYIAN